MFYMACLYIYVSCLYTIYISLCLKCRSSYCEKRPVYFTHLCIVNRRWMVKYKYIVYIKWKEMHTKTQFTWDCAIIELYIADYIYPCLIFCKVVMIKGDIILDMYYLYANTWCFFYLGSLVVSLHIIKAVV